MIPVFGVLAIISLAATIYLVKAHVGVQREWRVVHRHAEYEDGFERGVNIGVASTVFVTALALFIGLGLQG